MTSCACREYLALDTIVLRQVKYVLVLIRVPNKYDYCDGRNVLTVSVSMILYTLPLNVASTNWNLEIENVVTVLNSSVE